MLPFALVGSLETILEAHTASFSTISASTPLSGGSINKAAKISWDGQLYFVKWNQSSAFPQMLAKEALGLHLIGETNTVFVPQIIGHGDNGSYQFLVLSMISEHRPSKKAWQTLGIKLAHLHSHHETNFGLGYDNYIGSLEQKNDFNPQWPAFFAEQRLGPLLDKLKKQEIPDKQLLLAFDQLLNRLPYIFPDEKPSLLHGDLWNGNVLCDQNGHIHLTDPAVYYGNREMDIAMTKLFGGFSHDFYDAYNTEFPLQKGWEDRLDVCNIYPLLVHAVLFGEFYLHQLRFQLHSLLQRFG